MKPLPCCRKSGGKDDIPFIEVTVAGLADALITGNKRHFKGKTNSCLNGDQCSSKKDPSLSIESVLSLGSTCPKVAGFVNH